MKNFAGTFFAAALLVGFVPPHTFAQNGEGRYQLFQGEYTHVNGENANTTQQKEIFLLDTATGDVQVYNSGETKGRKVKYFAPAVVDETKPVS